MFVCFNFLSVPRWSHPNVRCAVLHCRPHDQTERPMEKYLGEEMRSHGDEQEVHALKFAPHPTSPVRTPGPSFYPILLSCHRRSKFSTYEKVFVWRVVDEVVDSVAPQVAKQV